MNMVEDHDFDMLKKNVRANKFQKNEPIPLAGSGINHTCFQSDQICGSGPSTGHFTTQSLIFLTVGRYHHSPHYEYQKTIKLHSTGRII